MASMYEAIGGEPALQSAVDRFYERVIGDPMLASFFQGLDLGKVKAHQAALLGQAIGGPARYTGAELRRAHEHLRIEHRHFHAVAGHLVAALEESGFPEPVIGTMLECLTPLAGRIVNTAEAEAAIPD